VRAIGSQLELKDIVHLREAEPLFEQIVTGGPGLVIVAGMDPRPHAATPDGEAVLPSGRATILRILMHQMLFLHPAWQATMVAEARDLVRSRRPLRRRIHLSPVDAPDRYAAEIQGAAESQPDLLVVGRLTAETAPVALAAAQSGLRVLSQSDTIFRGPDLARHLEELGVSRHVLGALTWVVAVQRLATLCPKCKEPAPVDPAQWAELTRRFPGLADEFKNETFFHAPGCASCRHTGRSGDIAAFDLFHADPSAPGTFKGASMLPLEAYMLGLAHQGHLPLDDVLRLGADELHRAVRLMSASERALAHAKAELELKLAELQAANQVLEQRTEALVSLEGIGQALITSASLEDLAARLCRSACALCGADRAILYYVHPEPGAAEVLAVSGWDATLVHQPLDTALLTLHDADITSVPPDRRPPGVPPCPADATSRALRAALRVPLIAQDRPVGLMVVHTSQKDRFAPGEVALLQTFANHAALAMQRAGLVDTLQDKITQLQAAQAELVQKERMDRELELARQVQQSVLPRVFPQVPGCAFAARNRPARQVGGDFYDVIALDADHVGLVIGDVSGKGMPAALYMALTRSLLLAQVRRETSAGLFEARSPRDVLTSVHQLLRQLGEPGMFVTVFYGVVDARARHLTYARAGHDRPLLLRGGCVQALAGEGTVLGFPDLDDLRLSEERIDLMPGDRLVLYTDGLTDSLGPDGKAYGITRLTSLLQSYEDLPPSQLCRQAFAKLANYQGADEQFDDMTILVIEVAQNNLDPDSP
jgi:serine phosphatase RsbU (regulator of sigma subunit)